LIVQQSNVLSRTSQTSRSKTVKHTHNSRQATSFFPRRTHHPLPAAYDSEANHRLVQPIDGVTVTWIAGAVIEHLLVMFEALFPIHNSDSEQYDADHKGG
jgi:hypothetical protein